MKPQYPKKIPIDVTLRYMAWRNVKNLNQILHFWNLWVKGFQTVYKFSKLNNISEEALNVFFLNYGYFIIYSFKICAGVADIFLLGSVKLKG